MAGASAPGGELITPYSSSPPPAVSVGWVPPVFVDIDPVDFNIDPKRIGRPSRRTKAIIPIHLYGKMADMGR